MLKEDQIKQKIRYF